MPINTSLTCPYCKFSSLDSPKYHAQELMFGTKEEFTYISCNNCGSLYLEEVPANLGQYYSSTSYYSFNSLVTSPTWKKTLKKIRETIFRASNFQLFKPVYGDWWSVLKPQKHSKIADIGCGNGQLLYELFSAGYTSLSGFDPFLTDEQNWKDQLRLYKTGLSEIKDQFDLIMFHHSLEHMPNPSQVLQQSSRLLKANGQLLIRIPVADAQVWKDDGVNRIQLDAPRHLHIPTVRGFKQLADNLGFKVIKITFDSTEFQFWGTEIYKKGIPLKNADPNKLFKKEELSSMKKKALQYNLKNKGDQACFYLVKIN